MMNKRIITKSLIVGILTGALHLLLTFFLYFYFGLGMDPKGVWFVLNVFTQPGELISSIFDLGDPDLSNLKIASNVLFYSILGATSYYIVKSNPLKGNWRGQPMNMRQK